MREVLKLPAFRRLLAVSMIDQLALSAGAVALALLVYRRTGSAIGAAGFFLCAEFAPALLSPLLVARLDQRSTRRVLPTLYLAQGIIYLLLARLVHRFAVAPVLALVVLVGTFAITAAVLARTAWTAVVSPRGLLRDGNAVVNTGYSICFMLGPAVGGALVATTGTVPTLLIATGAYVANSLLSLTARGLPAAVRDRSPTAGRLRAAMQYVRGAPVIRRLLGLQTLGVAFFAISIPVEVVLAQHTLHAGPGGYGVILAAWGAGAIAGSAAYVRWRRLSSRILVTAGTCLLGVGFLAMAVAPSVTVAVIGSAIGGIGNGIQAVSMRTAIQEAVSESWMALILSLNQLVFQAVPGIGILVGGAVAAFAGPRIALAVGAVGSLMMALTMWLRLDSVEVAALPQSALAETEDGHPELTQVARQP